MKNLAMSVLMLGLCVVAGPTLAQETEIEGSRFTVADQWWGGATADAEGRFDYCSVSIDYDATTRLSYILRSDDAFVVIASLGGADFPAGEVVDVVLTGETFGPDNVRARAVNPTTIAIPMPGIDAIAGIIRQNGRISIEVAGRKPDIFHTPGADAAVNSAMACHDRYSALQPGPDDGTKAAPVETPIEGSEFQAGIWRGFATRNSAQHSTACMVMLAGAFGEKITFILGSDNRFLVLMELPEPRLAKDQQYDVSMWTNVNDAIAVPATAFDTKTLAVVFTDIAWSVAYLESGQTLTVTGEGFNQVFSIANANLAL
ncbi:MAG TPA: hypothetical protein VK146_14810, partial [Tabrizicola sp.]|nr:hypothetical protein [Tabrizicola sp.]